MNTVYCSREIASRDGREFHADDAHELNRLISKFSREFSPNFVREWHAAYQRYCGNQEDIVIVHHTR
jgi:hypothetical protein